MQQIAAQIGAQDSVIKGFVWHGIANFKELNALLFAQLRKILRILNLIEKNVKRHASYSSLGGYRGVRRCTNVVRTTYNV